MAESDVKRDYYIPRASKTWFFLNKELVRTIKEDRAQNIVLIWNDTQQKKQLVVRSEYLKNRQRAYTRREIAKTFEKTLMSFTRGVTKGYLPKGYIKYPRGYIWEPGTRGWRGGPNRTIYYSEDQLYEIREAWAKMDRGRPRADGMVARDKTWVPSEAELDAILGRGMMLYTKTGEGRFIPVWSERSWD